MHAGFICEVLIFTKFVRHHKVTNFNSEGNFLKQLFNAFQDKHYKLQVAIVGMCDVSCYYRASTRDTMKGSWRLHVSRQ